VVIILKLKKNLAFRKYENIAVLTEIVDTGGIWNGLPYDVVNANNTGLFKKRLDMMDFSSYLHSDFV
jgi:hypothetical protein